MTKRRWVAGLPPRDDSWMDRSRLTTRVNRFQVRDMSKSDLESYRRNHPVPTSFTPVLRTEKPLRKIRGLGPAGRLPREGQGDFRYVDNVPVYRGRRNGMPATKPYVWGASVGTRSWANLDWAAIAAADAEFGLDGRSRNGGARHTQAAPEVRNEILRLYDMDPTLRNKDIARALGCSASYVSNTLRALRVAEPPRCPACGYLLVSQAHRMTCLDNVPDAEPPASRRLRPEDIARLRGVA